MFGDKYKGDSVFFVEFKSNGDHPVYLSAYGKLACEMLDKYVEGQRVDNEELFAEWDESIQKAVSQVGFTATHPVEDGYLYISSFQNGVSASSER